MSRKGDWNPTTGGVAADHGLAKAVGGATAHRGGSDGRDVVGGGCMPLLARAPATNDHPWSIHGGFIRQVRPTRRVGVDVIVVVVVVVAVLCPSCRFLLPVIRGLVCFHRGDPRGSEDAREGREMYEGVGLNLKLLLRVEGGIQSLPARKRLRKRIRDVK